jgi:hypothetical protein
MAAGAGADQSCPPPGKGTTPRDGDMLGYALDQSSLPEHILQSCDFSFLHVDLLSISNARGISSGDHGGHGVTGFGNSGDHD